MVNINSNLQVTVVLLKHGGTVFGCCAALRGAAAGIPIGFCCDASGLCLRIHNMQYWFDLIREGGRGCAGACIPIC